MPSSVALARRHQNAPEDSKGEFGPLRAPSGWTDPCPAPRGSDGTLERGNGRFWEVAEWMMIAPRWLRSALRAGPRFRRWSDSGFLRAGASKARRPACLSSTDSMTVYARRRREHGRRQAQSHRGPRRPAAQLEVEQEGFTVRVTAHLPPRVERIAQRDRATRISAENERVLRDADAGNAGA